MSSAPRRLVVIRHAKAAAPDGSDHERPLVDSGIADATALGHWLRERTIVADVVLCSTAVRTRETWAAIVAGSGEGALVAHDQRIYNASVDTLLSVVREEAGHARTVVLVGHSPGIPGLAAVLSEGQPYDDAARAIESGFPTCTAAVIEVDVPWSKLSAGTGRLVAVHTARADDSA